MGYVTNIRKRHSRSKSKLRKIDRYNFWSRDTTLRNKAYKRNKEQLKKEQLKMDWNFANDHDLYNEAA